MARTGPSESESIHREYPHGAKILKVEREGEPPRYRFTAPYQPLKSYDEAQVEWDNEMQAELYADVWTITNLREEKTGPRGIPPEVAKDGREATVAYLNTMPGMGSTEWLANYFNVDRETIHQYRSRVRQRAKEYRENVEDDHERE